MPLTLHDAPPAAIGGSTRGPAGSTPSHRVAVRLWHWTVVLAMVVLVMSGLTIFNAHPRLYWGPSGNLGDPAWFEIGDADFDGYLRLGEFKLVTTGTLGISENAEGFVRFRAFPEWATIPSAYNLGNALRWHFAFAWVLVLATLPYVVWGFATGHFRRCLLPARWELRPGHAMRELLGKLVPFVRCPECAGPYGIWQKLVYAFVVFGLVPLVVLTGLGMAPGLAPLLGGFVEAVGGRQTVRSLHFLAAAALVAFVALHLVMVLTHRPLRALWAMTLGRNRPRRGPEAST